MSGPANFTRKVWILIPGKLETIFVLRKRVTYYQFSFISNATSHDVTGVHHKAFSFFLFFFEEIKRFSWTILLTITTIDLVLAWVQYFSPLDLTRFGYAFISCILWCTRVWNFGRKLYSLAWLFRVSSVCNNNKHYNK